MVVAGLVPVAPTRIASLSMQSPVGIWGGSPLRRSWEFVLVRLAYSGFASSCSAEATQSGIVELRCYNMCHFKQLLECICKYFCSLAFVRKQISAHVASAA